MPSEDLPTGIVTFLFTDIEGHTRILERFGERYGAIKERHDPTVRSAIAVRGVTTHQHLSPRCQNARTTYADAVQLRYADERLGLSQRELVACHEPRQIVQLEPRKEEL